METEKQEKMEIGKRGDVQLKRWLGVGDGQIIDGQIDNLLDD